MTSGHGGCDPFGMAVALARRGLGTEVFVSQAGPLFLDGVRSKDKRAVMSVTQEEFREEALALGIPVYFSALAQETLTDALDDGALAIVLVSTFRMFRERRPHWLLVHGHDDRHVFVHDPWVEPDELESPVAAAGLPIPIEEFERMACYGRDKLRAAVLVSAEPPR